MYSYLHVVPTDLKIKTGSSICRSQIKSLAAILGGPIQYIETDLHWGVLFSLMIFGMLWMISKRLNNRAAIVKKNTGNIISLAAMLGGQVNFEAIGFKIWIKEQQNAQSSLNFEISGSDPSIRPFLIQNSEDAVKHSPHHPSKCVYSLKYRILPSYSVGPLFVDTKPMDLEKAMKERFMRSVRKGGAWKPDDCVATKVSLYS